MVKYIFRVVFKMTLNKTNLKTTSSVKATTNKKNNIGELKTNPSRRVKDTCRSKTNITMKEGKIMINGKKVKKIALEKVIR